MSVAIKEHDRRWRQLANGPWQMRPRSDLVENSPGNKLTTVFVPIEKVRYGAEVLLGILRD